MRVGLSTTAIFGDLSGYFFGIFRDKASSITWRYATPCRLITDCKMNDLERLFDVKIRFRPMLCCSIDTSFGAHCTNLNEDRPILSATKCRSMTIVSENIRFMRIFAGVPLSGGIKRHWGLSTTAIFRWVRLQKLQRYGKHQAVLYRGGFRGGPSRLRPPLWRRTNVRCLYDAVIDSVRRSVAQRRASLTELLISDNGIMATPSPVISR